MDLYAHFSRLLQWAHGTTSDYSINSISIGRGFQLSPDENPMCLYYTVAKYRIVTRTFNVQIARVCERKNQKSGKYKIIIYARS